MNLFKDLKTPKQNAFLPSQVKQIAALVNKVQQLSLVDLTAAMFNACKQGNNADLTLYIQECRRRDIDLATLKNTQQESLLDVASQTPCANLVKMLRQEPEFDIAAQAGLCKTSLMHAASAGQTLTINNGLLSGLTAQQRQNIIAQSDDNGRNALMYAVLAGKDATLHALIKSYGVPAYRQCEDKRGWNVLCYALHVIRTDAPRQSRFHSHCLSALLDVDHTLQLYQTTNQGIIPITCLTGYQHDLPQTLRLLEDCRSFMADRQIIDVLREQTQAALNSSDGNIRRVAKHVDHAFKKTMRQSQAEINDNQLRLMSFSS